MELSGPAVFLLGLLGLAILVVAHRLIRRELLGRAPCPQCGARGLTKRTRVVREPGDHARGLREETTECPACGWRAVQEYPMARRPDPTQK